MEPVGWSAMEECGRRVAAFRHCRLANGQVAPNFVGRATLFRQEIGAAWAEVDLHLI
jgi:hypothetical protein